VSKRRAKLRIAAASLIAAFLLPASAEAQSDWRDTTARVGVRSYDVLILRPLHIAATVVGFGFFVPAALLSAPGGKDNIVQAWEMLVQTPGEAAFKRPLGEF